MNNVVLSHSNFINFIFNHTAIKADVVRVSDSLFNNEAFKAKGAFGFRL